MTPTEAAQQVVAELREELAIADDRIEREALITTMKAFQRFAELMEGAQ